jgi:hypothetical protein
MEFGLARNWNSFLANQLFNTIKSKQSHSKPFKIPSPSLPMLGI